MNNTMQKVYVVTSHWNNDGETEPDTIKIFGNKDSAIKHLAELVKQEKETGMMNDWNDDPDDREISLDEPDYYHAWNESANKWIEFEVTEMEVNQ